MSPQRELYEKYGILKDVMIHPSAQKFIKIPEKLSNVELIGEPILQEGVINYPARQAGLCMGVTDAPYATTTEVYPDSPRATPEQCNEAQVAAVTGALDFILRAEGACDAE